MVAELLALLIELTSVGIAGKQLKKTVEVPRPDKPSSTLGRQRSATDAAFKKGIGVLAATSRAVSAP